MPIDRVTAQQFADQITAGINNRNAALDTAMGPIPDCCIFPQATVFEAENDRARLLSLWLTLSDASAFTGFDSTLDGIVFNEGMTRSTGSGSTATVVFSVSAAPSVDAVVPRGFPIGTQLDANSGTTVTFVTTESVTLPAAAASSYLNLATQKYELQAPVLALTTGSASNVGPNNINRPLRPLASFETVTNPVAATGGLSGETNQQLINRYLLGVVGRQLGTPNGIIRAVEAAFADVQDIALVYGTDPLLVRAASDAGAVDAWVENTTVTAQATENHGFLGVGQTMVLNFMPLVAVLSVSSGATTYAEGSDYVVVFDDSGVSRSTREASGVAFLAGGPATLPVIGAAVTVTYSYDSLIIALQNDFGTGSSGPVQTGDPETEELGRDLLFRRGIAVPIAHSAVLSVRAGFSITTVSAAVRSTVLALVNGLGLGVPVRDADIIAAAKGVSGVLNYVVTRLTLTTVTAGTTDVPIGNNSYATMLTADYILTLG